MVNQVTVALQVLSASDLAPSVPEVELAHRPVHGCLCSPAASAAMRSITCSNDDQHDHHHHKDD
jgi:hypothetical protein